MKKKVTKIVTFCDVCNQEAGLPRSCFRCGKEICYDCSERNLVVHPGHIFSSGHGDGYYCVACDQHLLRERTDPLHSAYLSVRILRSEQIAWQQQFKERVASVEQETYRLFKLNEAKAST